MHVSIENNKVLIECTYDKKDLVKAIGNYKFNKNTKLWEFPLSSLIPIIEQLRIDYDESVEAKYHLLKEEQGEYEKKLVLASQIKAGKQLSLPEGIDVSKLFSHQKTALSLASLFDSYALFLEMGLGKSLVAIKLIELHKPAIVVAPLSTLESVWVNEIKKWSNLTCVNLWQNLDALEKDYDVFLINFEHFKKIKDVNKIKTIVIDESAKMKNFKSGITKHILSFKDKVEHKYILSGKPAPNDLMEYFAQAAFVNNELLGDNFYRFRGKYFYSSGYGGYLYMPYSGAKEEIMKQLSKQAYFIKKEEAVDLPERIFETRLVEMDKVQRQKYDEMMKLNIMEYKNHVVLGANELAKIAKLREISSGFVIGESGLTVEISKSKIEELLNVISEIDDDRQVIIWCNFHWEINRIAQELSPNATTLYGEMNQKEKNQAIKEFQDGKYRFIISHPLSGGMGLTFTNCSYIIWFSLSYSVEQYDQANDRVHRVGQLNKCTYIHLLAKDSIDGVIYKVLKKKQRFSEACLKMLKEGWQNHV